MEAQPARSIERLIEAASRVVLQCPPTMFQNPARFAVLSELKDSVNTLRRECGLSYIAPKRGDQCEREPEGAAL
jgi:hypothetical protein